ncbi:phosphopyruvate hydratase [Vibrio rotiferianus]|uniref:Enolase n=1 Tax=Vibrio sp. DAT722 TaxID=344879 RepID=Q2F9Q2_9VIBR|nr:phosphopyruvate hydratase [Vibrio rotiferianus]ABA55969.1 enolase [Vibrio sp. DAT722]
MDFLIEDILAREILDSRGNPTVEVEVTLGCGITARASVPSGASTGSREAVELRDGDDARFGGKGVLNAVQLINTEVLEAIVGLDSRDQALIDRIMIELDGTENKSRLGANGILGVSLAVARASAMTADIPLYKYLGGVGANLLPVPCMNILNGGVHARWQGPDFQEYMIAPYGAKNFRQAVQWGSEVYHALRQVLLESDYSVGVGDEGGFAPAVKSNREPLELIVKGIERAGLKPGVDVGICMDPASSEFYENGKYKLRSENRELTSAEMIEYYEKLVEDFPVVLLEDGLAEDDWDNWPLLNEKLGGKIEIVGDDLLVTNTKYIQKAIEMNAANSALIKLNQIGSLTETIEAIQMCHHAAWGAFVSHRSGETTDSFIADMTVALRTGHLKTGAPCRGERVEKYNQLMRIEDELGSMAVFAGRKAFIR